MRTLVTITALAVSLGMAAPVSAASLHALTADGKLVRVDSDSLRAGPAMNITGAPVRSWPSRCVPRTASSMA